jgi:hypothetical protein
MHIYTYTMEFYSAIRWCEGKLLQLEDIMLSEVSHAQKDKGCMFSLMDKVDTTQI